METIVPDKDLEAEISEAVERGFDDAMKIIEKEQDQPKHDPVSAQEDR